MRVLAICSPSRGPTSQTATCSAMASSLIVQVGYCGRGARKLACKSDSVDRWHLAIIVGMGLTGSAGPSLSELLRRCATRPSCLVVRQDRPDEACLPSALLTRWPCSALHPALAQMPGGPPPAVGVVTVEKKPITETSEFIGRIQAVDRVELVARVTAFLEQRLFTEGAEVKAGDLLYQARARPVRGDGAAQAGRRGAGAGAAGEQQHHAQPRAVAAEHAGRAARDRG